MKLLELREGNEESSEETTGCKASVCEEFDDCPRDEKFFRFDQSDRKTYKKAISDDVNVSVVLDMVSRNTSE